MSQIGQRHYRSGSAYYYCARCGIRYLLSEMTWQRGILLCHVKCYDEGIDPLVGDRENSIGRALEIPSRELEPDEKLITTDGSTTADDTVYF